MTEPTNSNGWKVNERYVLREIERCAEEMGGLKAEFREFQDEIRESNKEARDEFRDSLKETNDLVKNVQLDMARYGVKMSLWGGLIVAVTAGIGKAAGLF